MDELLTVAEAASRYGVSTVTIFRMIKKGTLPKVIVGERSVRIPASALKAARPTATRTEKAVQSEIKKSRPQNLDAKIRKLETKLARLRQQRQMEASGGYLN